MTSYIDPPADLSVSSSRCASPAVLPVTGCYGRPDPQIVNVRVSPPNSSTSLAEAFREPPQPPERDEPKKDQSGPEYTWQLKPQDSKMQTLYNFNEVAIPPKNQFYPSDETSHEKLKLLYGDSKISPCCDNCSSPCCCPACSCQSCVIL
ncbi:PREDICTED: uncharacterized protein LOC109472074 isoform X1 [Branchiostoma belcheri]|uniref:Uncharacterized protein LOC109472074 isoform X1 n=1 Tax=Branchiostoma belcheri TaxID=7741 RepID=A0A6P4YDG8_BRABE|nr:PREDICTED: uncharacterized protein LOC109472074 isoform X1 [Branchiostoma belcheri]